MKYIALDTEFVWNSTYFAKLGLVQTASAPESGIADSLGGAAFRPIPSFRSSDVVAIADPLASAPGILGDIFENREIVKIFHDHTMDRKILERWSGKHISSIFDTQTAAGFCGQKSTVSLQQAVKDNLGFTLDKTETRTDWLQRPLSGSQLHYAADDVAYLSALMQRLTDIAEKNGNLQWLTEEMDRISSLHVPYGASAAAGAWKKAKIQLSKIKKHEEFSRLKMLCEWRELIAVERDLPRSWVLPDKTIAQLVFFSEAKSGISSIPGVLPRDADVICSILKQADDIVGDPPHFHDFSLSVRAKADKKAAEIAQHAESRHIDPALVASRSDILQWCENPDDPDLKLNTGWRRNFT